MPKKQYKLPATIIGKLRDTYANEHDIVDNWGLNYLQRVADSYRVRTFDLDAQARRFNQPVTWLEGQGEYMTLACYQMEMLSGALRHEIPLWHCEHVLGVLHREVYAVPELRERFVELMTEGWERYTSTRSPLDIVWNETMKRGVSEAIMRGYPPVYHRYMTLRFSDSNPHAL